MTGTLSYRQAEESEGTTLYLAEVFAPRCTRDRLRAESVRVRAAAEALADSGEPVRYLGSLLVPGEEIAFYLFEAEQPEAIERALRGAGLEAERISLAIPADGQKPDGHPAGEALERAQIARYWRRPAGST